MFYSVKAGKLTVAGAVAGGLMGLAIFAGAGFPGLVMLGTFFFIRHLGYRLAVRL